MAGFPARRPHIGAGPYYIVLKFLFGILYLSSHYLIYLLCCSLASIIASLILFLLFLNPEVTYIVSDSSLHSFYSLSLSSNVPFIHHSFWGSRAGDPEDSH